MSTVQNRKTLYEHLPPNNTTELKPWYMVHVDLIGPYRNSTRQYNQGGGIIKNNVSLKCMTTNDPAMGWFEFFEFPTSDLDEVMGVNDEYIDKSYSRVIQLSKNIWLCRYPRPQKVVFDIGYEFKLEFNTLIKDFYIKPILRTIKEPQANALVKRVHKVILDMLVTKDLDNKALDYIDPWGETIEYISWKIRASYNHTIQATP